MSRQRAALCLSSRFFGKTASRAALLGAVLIAPLALSAPVGAATDTPPAAAKPAVAKPAAAKPASTARSTTSRPGACYSRSEHAAEQLMRMHTEMMVVGLTCRTVVPEKNPFGLYQDFSVKNRALLSSSEATLIGFYKKTGGGVRQFDTYRTELANEISRRAATIGIPQYCQTFVDRSKAAKDLDAEDSADPDLGRKERRPDASRQQAAVRCPGGQRPRQPDRRRPGVARSGQGGEGQGEGSGQGPRQTQGCRRRRHADRRRALSVCDAQAPSADRRVGPVSFPGMVPPHRRMRATQICLAKIHGAGTTGTSGGWSGLALFGRGGIAFPSDKNHGPSNQ